MYRHPLAYLAVALILMFWPAILIAFFFVGLAVEIWYACQFVVCSPWTWAIVAIWLTWLAFKPEKPVPPVKKYYPHN